MRVKLKLGFNGKEFVIDWPGTVTTFPKILSYKGDKWEFAMYSPSKEFNIDNEFMFSSLDPYYVVNRFGYMDSVDLEDLLGKHSSKCQCGAAHTSFPQFHMFFCPEYKSKP